MSTGMFMQMTGIEGESEDENHVGWIEIESWEVSYDQPLTPAKDSDGSQFNRAEHEGLEISKKLDKASASLKKKCWKGEKIDNVKIECFRSLDETASISAYLILELTDVFITEYSLKSNEGELPDEDLTLDYVEIKFTYKPADKKTDVLGAQTVASHNRETNTIT